MDAYTHLHTHHGLYICINPLYIHCVIHWDFILAIYIAANCKYIAKSLIKNSVTFEIFKFPIQALHTHYRHTENISTGASTTLISGIRFATCTV